MDFLFTGWVEAELYRAGVNEYKPLFPCAEAVRNITNGRGEKQTCLLSIKCVFFGRSHAGAWEREYF
jgi:hypothetical protein